MKDCPHAQKASDSLHYSSLRPPERKRRDGWRWSGHAWRGNNQTLGKEDSPPLSGQNPGRVCGFNRRRLFPVQPLRVEAGAISRKCGARGSGASKRLANRKVSARQIAEEAMKIAGKMCIYTNEKVTIEEL